MKEKKMNKMLDVIKWRLLSIVIFPLVIVSCKNNKKVDKIPICHEQVRYEGMKDLVLPNGIKTYLDYEWAIDCAISKQKPLFVYFTGHGCMSDKSYEKLIFFNDTIKNLLNNEFITTVLYVDERSKLLPEEYIIDDENDTIKTIGKKNAYWQIKKFDNNSQPYFVLLDQNQNLLNDPVSNTEATDVNTFIDFLTEGLNKYKSKK